VPIARGGILVYKQFYKNKMYIIKHKNQYLLDKQDVYGDYLIDGKNIGDLNKLLPLQFDHLPIIKSVKKSIIVDHYINPDKDKLSVDKYKEKYKLLYKGDEDGDFGNLEEEYKFRRFTEEWKTVTKNIVEYKTINLVVLYKNASSKYGDIVPIYMLEENRDSELFIWTPNFQQYVTKIAKKYGFVAVGFKLNHSQTIGRKYAFGREENLEYMTCNGSYASNLYDNYSLKISSRRGSYEELVAMRKGAVDLIDSYFKREYESTLDSEIVNVGVVVKELNTIKNMISRMNLKVTTVVNKTSVIGVVDKLINKLVEEETK